MNIIINNNNIRNIGDNPTMSDVVVTPTSSSTSMTSRSNPLHDDPQLRELLKRLDQEVHTQTQFVQWKAEFLERFELYLPEKGAAVATRAYQRFAQALYHLLRLLKRVEQNLRSGGLSSKVGQSTVKGRHCLAEFGAQVAVVSTHLDTLIPGTVEMQDQAGYNKFQMVAVLVRDAFPEYGSLKVLSDIFAYLRQYSLNAVADKIILKELDIYSAKLTKFLDIIADLGLYKAICKYNIKKEVEEESSMQEGIEADNKEQDVVPEPVSEPAPVEKEESQEGPTAEVDKKKANRKKPKNGFDDEERARRMLQDSNYDPQKESEKLKWDFHDYYHGDPTSCFLHTSLPHYDNRLNMFPQEQDEESDSESVSGSNDGYDIDFGIDNDSDDDESTTSNSSMDDHSDGSETMILLTSLHGSMHTNKTVASMTPISILEEDNDDDDDSSCDRSDDSSDESTTSNSSMDHSEGSETMILLTSLHSSMPTNKTVASMTPISILDEDNDDDEDDDSSCDSSDGSSEDMASRGGAYCSLRPNGIRGNSIVEKNDGNSNVSDSNDIKTRGGPDRSLRPGLMRGETFDDDDDDNDNENNVQLLAPTNSSNSGNEHEERLQSNRFGDGDHSLRPRIVRGESFDDIEGVKQPPSRSSDDGVVKSRGGANRSLRPGIVRGETFDDNDEICPPPTMSSDDTKSRGGPDRSLRPGMIRGKSFDDDNEAPTPPRSSDDSCPKSHGGADRSVRPGLVRGETFDDIDSVHQWMLSREW